METVVKTLEQILLQGETAPPIEWQVRVIQSEQCFSYVAWNTRTKEALVIDPKREDTEAYYQIASELVDYVWLAVIDTHTHADHVSSAAAVAGRLGTALVMHESALTAKAQILIRSDCALPAHASPIRVLVTPGHTPDSITPIWGPFIFGGDTILFGDTGRDDLPGGSPEAHFDSVQIVKAAAGAGTSLILLPGHDPKGGRASTWSKQLELNASLQQSREDFVREASAYDAPSPALLKESLRENFK
jgi:glyoxylase-like metal-dependent hydrolase (beta-lactamase superfamily II)